MSRPVDGTGGPPSGKPPYMSPLRFRSGWFYTAGPRHLEGDLIPILGPVLVLDVDHPDPRERGVWVQTPEGRERPT